MNRIELLHLLSKNSICAELGVYRGTFSEKILNIVKPKKLYLIDVWKNITLNYDDKAMSDDESHEERYQEVLEKFNHLDNVEIVRNTTDIVKDIFPKEYLDWVFIDADHSYEGCKKDLESINDLVKIDGYIIGHDYNTAFQGIIDAVDEFVEKNNYFLTYITTEKIKTYVISKTSESDQKFKEKLEYVF